MTDFIALVRVLAINAYRIDKDQKKQKRLVYALLAAGFGPLIVMMSVAMFFAGQATARNAPEASANVLSLLFGAGALVVMFFGITAMLQVMFFSSDADFLFTLPVRRGKIFLAKLAVVYITEVLTVSALLPIALCFGIGLSAGGAAVSVAYWITLPAAILIVPLIPLFLIALLSFPVMYIVSFLKRKSMFALVGGLALFAVIFAVYFGGVSYFSSLGETAGESGAGADLTELFLNFAAAGKYLYPFSFLAEFMMLRNPLLNLALFLLSAGALFAAALLICGGMYGRGVRAQQGGGKSPAEKTSVDLNVAAGTIEKELFKKEFKLLVRNTGFAFQSFLGVVIAPIIIVFYGNMYTLGGGVSQELFSLGISMFMIFMMVCGLNYTAHVAFTREGAYFYMNKFLPVPFRAVFDAKLKLAQAVSFAGIALSAVVVAVANLSVAGSVPLALLNFALVCAVAGVVSYSLNRFGMLRDLKRPNLKWNNVREAVKNNTYVMLPMFISAAGGFFIMIAGAVFGSLSLFGGGGAYKAFAYAAFWVCAALVSVLIFVVFGMKKFENIDAMLEKIET
ncbi:MAG: hypothetical protein LBP79_01090 [Clostridiales bacterium]|jgi:hypothetical protein|nr:hypothetical protein [Clostridiales bacterium]